MKIQITPIPFGLDKQAVSITLDWGKKELFSDDLTLLINFFDDGNNFFSVKEVQMTTDEYVSKGDTKEDRINTILSEIGIVKVDVPLSM